MLIFDVVTLFDLKATQAFLKSPTLTVYASSAQADKTLPWLLQHWKARGTLFVVGQKKTSKYFYNGSSILFQGQIDRTLEMDTPLIITSKESGIYSVKFNVEPRLTRWFSIENDYSGYRQKLDAIARIEFR